MNRPTSIVAGTLAALLLLFGAFGAYEWSYYAIRNSDWLNIDASESVIAILEYVYWPADAIDRLIWPNEG